MFYFILAVSEDGAIGIDSTRLPWRIDEEYAYFLDKINCRPKSILLCGRRTFECIEKTNPELVERCVILSSSSHSYHSCHSNKTLHSMNEVVEFLQNCRDNVDETVWCLGGATLYNQIEFLRPSKVYLTRIKKTYDNDKLVELDPTFFESLEINYRCIILSKKCLLDKKSGEWLDCDFLVYSLIHH